jgi:hypothetical protein
MGPTDFLAKIPEIGLWRFSFRFSLEVIVAIHGNPVDIGIGLLDQSY